MVVAQRVLDALREPVVLPGHDNSFTVSASIGIAEGDRPGPDELLREADIALYEAKDAGKDRFVVFPSDMGIALHERIDLERDLLRALDSDELFLVYQPTFDLRGPTVIGFEALLRWRHPQRGVVPPSAFIPVADDTSLIVPIGRYVLEQACMQAASWHAQGYRVEMSVNVSARQLDTGTFRDDVALALQVSGLDPAYLVLTRPWRTCSSCPSTG